MVFLKKQTNKQKLNKPSALLCVHGSTGVHRGRGEGAPDQIRALSSGGRSSAGTCSGRASAKQLLSLEPQPGPPPDHALSARVRQRAPGPATSAPLGGVSRHVTAAAHLACPGCSAAEARPRPGIGPTSGAGRGSRDSASRGWGCLRVRPQLRGPTQPRGPGVWRLAGAGAGGARDAFLLYFLLAFKRLPSYALESFASAPSPSDK